LKWQSIKLWDSKDSNDFKDCKDCKDLRDCRDLKDCRNCGDCRHCEEISPDWPFFFDVAVAMDAGRVVTIVTSLRFFAVLEVLGIPSPSGLCSPLGPGGL